MKMELQVPQDRPDRLSIAPMSVADVADVTRIERASFSTVWPQDAFYNELRTNKLAHYFVGRLDDRIVAYGGIWVILEDSHITTLAVDPGVPPAGLRRGDAAAAHRRRARTRRRVDDARGAREQSGRSAALP